MHMSKWLYISWGLYKLYWYVYFHDIILLTTPSSCLSSTIPSLGLILSLVIYLSPPYLFTLFISPSLFPIPLLTHLLLSLSVSTSSSSLQYPFPLLLFSVFNLIHLSIRSLLIFILSPSSSPHSYSIPFSAHSVLYPTIFFLLFLSPSRYLSPLLPISK